LPNIVGPFFPSGTDTQHRDLYCASMLSLLTPWRDLEDLLIGFNNWEEAFNSFLANTSQWQRDVLAGVQYYYECRSAANASRSHNNESSGEIHGNVRNDIQVSNDEGNTEVEDSNDDRMQVELTEADLKTFKESQLSVREEAHGLAAVRIAQLRGVFDEEP
ncbi:hypothetical protein BV22DRAFT_992346, partial [Leucogyrophana mollusca]